MPDPTAGPAGGPDHQLRLLEKLFAQNRFIRSAGRAGEVRLDLVPGSGGACDSAEAPSGRGCHGLMPQTPAVWGLAGTGDGSGK